MHPRRRANHPVWYGVVRPFTALVLHLRRRAFLALEPVEPRPDVEHLGSRYGGWSVATPLVTAESVCYLAGVGEDATFDQALMERFGCDVHAFDPVPKAAEYVARELAGQPHFHFHAVGLWSGDRTLTFYAPEFEGWVSHSAVDFRHTPAVLEAPVRSVPSLMRELGHDHIDVLKLSVEGAEYAVLDSVLRAGLPVSQVLVEFTPPARLSKVRGAARLLRGAGYQLVAGPVGAGDWKCTFVRRTAPRAPE